MPRTRRTPQGNASTVPGAMPDESIDSTTGPQERANSPPHSPTMPPRVETSGEIAGPDLLADAEREDPTDNRLTELRHEFYAELSKLRYETAENTGLEPDVEDLKSSNKFLTESIAKVRDSVSHVHDELKRDLGNLNNEFIELQRKFMGSENKILNSIESLRLQLIDNNDHTSK